MFERLTSILIKEFKQAFRDPRMRAVIILVPIVQSLVFGFAVSTDVREIKTAIYDLDNSVQSREITALLSGSGYFYIVFRAENELESTLVLDKGIAKALFRFPVGFGADILSGKSAPLALLLDGTDSTTASIVLSYTNKIIQGYNTRVVMSTLERKGAVRPETDKINLITRAWFNENLLSRNFFVPGVIALLVMIVTLMLSAMAIVREKEIGTIEQIMVTPISQFEFILGKTIPFAVIGFVNVLLISVIAVTVFSIPLLGSLPLLFFSTALYLLSTLGLGLFLSTVSSTQQQAMMSTFFVFFPAVLLSGFIFPIANMPEFVQYVTYINPLRYFLVIVRGIFLKGVGFEILWPQLLGLAVLGIVLMSLAVSRFKKTTS